jgi:hypothetical protein
VLGSTEEFNSGRKSLFQRTLQASSPESSNIYVSEDVYGNQLPTTKEVNITESPGTGYQRLHESDSNIKR